MTHAQTLRAFARSKNFYHLSAGEVEALHAGADALEALEWRPIETAPKGGGAEMTTDPAWVEPPTILVISDGEVGKSYWDWFYIAWIDESTGEPFCYPPTHWLPLPKGPQRSES